MTEEPKRRVTVEFVETPIHIQVDMSRLSWGDLLELQRSGAGDGGDGIEASELLTRLVSKITGEDAETLPAVVVTAISEEVMRRVGGSPREKN